MVRYIAVKRSQYNASFYMVGSDSCRPAFQTTWTFRLFHKRSSTECQAHQAKLRSTVDLGSSGLSTSKIGLGTLQWGDPGQGYGQRFSKADLKSMFDQAIEGGINFFDTAEVYGYQGLKSGNSSEQLLGSFRADLHQKSLQTPLVVGTKFFTIPWTNLLVGGGFRLGKGSILEALTGSLSKLAEVDLYQVHFPFPTFPQQTLADALSEIMDRGLVKAVGVCNYKTPQMLEIHEILKSRGIPLATNQVKCNVLERGALTDGLLSACNDVGTSLVAHSPLSQGLLTGKYVETGGGQQAERIRPLLKLMQFIGAIYGGRSVTQVSLNYLVSQGVIPIPGAKSPEQLRDLVGSLDWSLEANEVEMINEKLSSLS